MRSVSGFNEKLEWLAVHQDYFFTFLVLPLLKCNCEIIKLICGAQVARYTMCDLGDSNYICRGKQ